MIAARRTARLHVVEEIEEVPPKARTLHKRHAVQGRAHGMFADAEVEVASAEVPGLEVSADAVEFQRSLIGGGQIGRTTNQPRHILRNRIQNFAELSRVATPLGSAGKAVKPLSHPSGSLCCCMRFNWSARSGNAFEYSPNSLLQA